MSVSQKLYKTRIRCFAALARRKLRSLRADKLRLAGRDAAMRTFRRAASRVEAYRDLLERENIDPASIRSIEQFHALPLTDKDSLFTANDLADLCLDARTDDLACVYTSSGHSKRFSFGLETHAQARRAAEGLDLMLELYLRASRTPTLLVNALPMGVQVPCRIPVKLDTSVRADAVLAVVRKMRPLCPQTVIVAEHHFLKKIIEQGQAEGMHWPDHRVSVVTGAETLPENYRDYIGGILGHEPSDLSRGRIFVSAGISEVGLTIGHETDGCRRLRRAAREDEALAEALFGFTGYLPSLVQYLPTEYYMETVEIDGLDRLVVTTCRRDRRIPLVRYNTNDWARVMDFDEVAAALRSLGRQDLTPEYRMPFLALFGRGRGVEVDGRTIYPEQVKEALYAAPELAPAFTANFRMSAASDAVGLRMQLVPGREADAELRAALTRHTSEQLGLSVQAELVPYHDFTEALDLCYQRKFRYLDRNAGSQT